MLSALPKGPFIQRLRQVLEQPARSHHILLSVPNPETTWSGHVDQRIEVGS